MDEIEIVERGISKTQDSATKDAAIQATETAEEKQKDEGICQALQIRILGFFSKVLETSEVYLYISKVAYD